MTLKDCIVCAAESLNLDAVAESLKNDTSPEMLSDSDARELEQLLSCARSAVNEVACEYAHLLTSENVQADTNGRIPFTALSKPIVEIVTVHSGRKSIPFRCYCDGIAPTPDAERRFAEGAEYGVTYAYIPSASELSDEIDFGNGKINPRTVGYGIAAEYYIRSGEASEAVLWDARYKDAMVAAAKRRREQRVKPRRWL